MRALLVGGARTIASSTSMRSQPKVQIDALRTGHQIVGLKALRRVRTNQNSPPEKLVRHQAPSATLNVLLRGGVRSRSLQLYTKAPKQKASQALQDALEKNNGKSKTANFQKKKKRASICRTKSPTMKQSEGRRPTDTTPSPKI